MTIRSILGICGVQWEGRGWRAFENTVTINIRAIAIICAIAFVYHLWFR
jgi:hypothetical protein